MANKTIESDDYWHENEDGTVLSVEGSIRINGDVSEIVHLYDPNGSHIAVWHVVHSAAGVKCTSM